LFVDFDGAIVMLFYEESKFFWILNKKRDTFSGIAI
jgi:hypothetical protein